MFGGEKMLILILCVECFVLGALVVLALGIKVV